MGSINAVLLPDSGSPSLHLDHPTDSENNAIWNLTSNAWKDALPVDIYIKESRYLMSVPLAEDGGMTQWVLVSKNDPPGRRLLLSSCETFRKRSWVSDPDGNISEVITHGVASVYTDPKYRGRGYASRLMRELASVLPAWQTGTTNCVASVLFSDIGKGFYTKLGWRAFPSHHVEFKPSSERSLSVSPILAGDLKQLCEEDEALSRKAMGAPCLDGKIRFMIVPDHEHMLWHHSKEEFAGETLFKKKPHIKGALRGTPGNRVWVVWTHRFYDPPSQTPSSNTLYILRLVVENLSSLHKGLPASPTSESRSPPTSEEYDLQVQALQAVISAARAEAADWGLQTVKLWDPSPQVKTLIQETGIPYSEEDREEDGICSLLWYGGEGSKTDDVKWVANEKYGWC